MDSRAPLSSEARTKALIEVHDRLDRGDSRSDALAFLRESGFQFADARHIVDTRIATNRSENRTKGIVRLVIAGVLLVLMAPILWGGSSIIDAPVRLRMRMQILVFAGFAGVVILFLVYRGLVFLLGGHRDHGHE